jgi:hypothetical protein
MNRFMLALAALIAALSLAAIACTYAFNAWKYDERHPIHRSLSDPYGQRN